MPEHFQAWAEGILRSQGQAPRAEAVANSVESLLSQSPEVSMSTTGVAAFICLMLSLRYAVCAVLLAYLDFTFYLICACQLMR